MLADDGQCSTDSKRVLPVTVFLLGNDGSRAPTSAIDGLAARKLRVAPETRDEVYCEVNHCDVPASDRAGDTCIPPARKLQPVRVSPKQAGFDNQSNKGSAGIKVASQ